MKRKSKPVAAAIALVLFAGVPVMEQSLSKFGVDFGANVAAASHGQGKGEAGQGKGKGGAGGHGGTSAGGAGGPQYKGGKSATGTSATTSDDDPDSDKRGPKYMGGENSNKPGDGDRGGKPAWAQEGIPEDVELGRLNVARAPEHVLLRQFDEAFKEWDSAMLALYTLSAEQAADLLRDQYDTVVRYDSPLMNLALYKDVVFDGESALIQNPASAADLAAIFLGSASDKTVEVTEGTVEAINIILGLTLDNLGISAADLAVKAEAVRDAIEDGHD